VHDKLCVVADGKDGKRIGERARTRNRDGRRAFPSPAAMAAVPESFYRDTVRAGYRRLI